MWIICLLISAIVLVTAAAAALSLCVKKYTRKRLLTPVNIMIVGVFTAAIVIFIPVYAESFVDGAAGVFKTFMISVHHAIRLFVIDSEFDIIRDSVPGQNPLLYSAYSSVAAVVFLLSPILTFGFVLSFFDNVSAFRRYLMGYRKNVYVFSKLNGKSIALAESVSGTDSNSMIIFADVSDENEDADYELKERAKELGAICFKDDILALKLKTHSPKNDMVFFVISEDETENIKQALGIIDQYSTRENTRMFVFSYAIEGELLLSSINKGLMKVRRVNDVTALAYMILNDTGELLFKEARETEDGTKLISAAVVGLGYYGREMVRALPWFCQMDGYRVEINGFDQSGSAYSMLYAECPDLINDKYNGLYIDGEAQYRIDIHENIDVETKEFAEALTKLKDVTYAFVALGDDELNIRAAIRMRTVFEKMGVKPRIQAVVHSSERKKALMGITNYSGQPYDIDFIGDIESVYAMGSLIDSKAEADALKRHMRWGEESYFWKYEYNYRSSMASAIHRKMKILCGMPGADKPPAERSDREKERMRIIEHRRWNAYMRAEGYTYAEKRNNLAKTHHCLVPFEDLSPEEQAKDDD